MESISFCVATGINEKEYLKLLLKSLKDNTELDNHEIIVWVDTDNQDTYGELKKLKEKEFPMLKIGKNKYSSQLGNQLNSSVMAQEAKNEIICFLHSDMVVGVNFDKEILIALDNNPQNIVCSSRIEPPLHPASPEKIIKNFGLSPEEFDYKSFQQFSKELALENRKNEEGYFAPCTFYRNTFLKILGGFDTQFRCSREDSDFILKLEMNKINQIISWKAIVYHFTCTSSRGKDWYKKETQDDLTTKVNWQKRADDVEMRRFVRKWGYFDHDYRPRYDISLNVDIDCVPNTFILLNLEPRINKLVINDLELKDHIIDYLNFNSYYYSNRKLGHTTSDWKLMKSLYPEPDFKDRILYSKDMTSVSPVRIKTKMSTLTQIMQSSEAQQVHQIFENINKIVSSNKPGAYELYKGITIEIDNNLIDINQYNITNKNLHPILESNEFNFE